MFAVGVYLCVCVCVYMEMGFVVCHVYDSPLTSVGITDPWSLPLSKQSTELFQLILIRIVKPVALPVDLLSLT